MSSSNLPTLFEDSDLSGLPANPNGNQPGKHASGVLFVGSGFTAPWAPVSHTHDDRYFTEAEITSLLASYATSSAVAASYLPLSGGALNGSLAINNDVAFTRRLEFYNSANNLQAWMYGNNALNKCGVGFFTSAFQIGSALEVSNSGDLAIRSGTGFGAVLTEKRLRLGGLNEGVEFSQGYDGANALGAALRYDSLNTVKVVASDGSSLGSLKAAAVSAPTFNPLAYVGAPTGASISASGGSSQVMVFGLGGASQVAMSGTSLVIPSTWSIGFASGNWNQTVDAQIVRSGSGQVDVRGDNGVRFLSLNAGSWVPAQAGKFLASSGSASAPGFSFISGASDTGPYLVNLTAGSRAYAISTDGAEAVRFGGSGVSRRADFAGDITMGNSLKIGAFSGSPVIDFQAVAFSTPSIGFSSNALVLWSGESVGTLLPIRFVLGSKTGAGTGAGEAMRLNTDKSATFSGGVSVTGTLTLGPFTVGTLPSASANPRAKACVTDSSVTTLGSTVAGGGSSNVEVRSNGTNWTVCGI